MATENYSGIMNKMKDTPLFTVSLVDQVYEYLLDKIITNEISYGDNLNIKELSKTLGISTMPVREAIKRLEYDRVVEVKPRSKCQIRIPDKSEIKDIYELREELELFAIKKFLKSGSPDQVKSLEEITDRMKNTITIQSAEKRAQEAMILDYEFHAELCKLADNEYVNYYHRQLSLHLNMALIHGKSYHQLKDKYFTSHLKIVKALKKKSPEAISSMEEHFNNVWSLL